jgi:phosphoribosylcarboxyaminoimidazole (NCAIR) mutase
MFRTKSLMLLVVALFVLPQFSLLEAQWVMAAHSVKNRIQQMTQKSSTGGYHVAIAGSSGYQNHVEKGEPSTTSMVVESVLRVCKEVDVNCSVEQ